MFLTFPLYQWAQTITPNPPLVITPGTSGTINLTLASGAGLQPVALQFTVNAPPEVGPLSIAIGAAAQTAGKSISCSFPPSSPAGATNTCAIWGLNVTPIADGIVAILTVPVLATATSTTETLGLSSTLGATAAGVGITLAATGATFSTIASFSPCDLNKDGVTDIKDVNLIVTQVITSINTPAACVNDLTGDGKCTVLDVYRVVVAALPTSSGILGAGVCKVGP
jgi:hypothetical protein